MSTTRILLVVGVAGGLGFAAAFKEAHKDLLAMRARITSPPGQPAAPGGNRQQQP